MGKGQKNNLEDFDIESLADETPPKIAVGATGCEKFSLHMEGYVRYYQPKCWREPIHVSTHPIIILANHAERLINASKKDNFEELIKEYLDDEQPFADCRFAFVEAIISYFKDEKNQNYIKEAEAEIRAKEKEMYRKLAVEIFKYVKNFIPKSFALPIDAIAFVPVISAEDAKNLTNFWECGELKDEISRYKPRNTCYDAPYLWHVAQAIVSFFKERNYEKFMKECKK